MSALTGFAVAVAALSPQTMLRLRFALLFSVRLRAAAPCALRVFSVLAKLESCAAPKEFT